MNLAWFPTSSLTGSSGKSPIFTYAELVSNPYSSEEVQFMHSHGTSGVTRILKVVGYSMISEFRIILKPFLGHFHLPRTLSTVPTVVYAILLLILQVFDTQ